MYTSSAYSYRQRINPNITESYVINQQYALSVCILLWKRPLYISNRQVVHHQEERFTVYVDICMYHASKMASS